MTDKRVVQLVIALLGISTIMLILGSIWLTYVVINKQEIDPTAVAVLAAVTGLAGTGLGGLIAMLVSTRSTPPAEPAEIL